MLPAMISRLQGRRLAPTVAATPLPADSGTQPQSLVEWRGVRTDVLAPPIAAARKISAILWVLGLSAVRGSAVTVDPNAKPTALQRTIPPCGCRPPHCRLESASYSERLASKAPSLVLPDDIVMSAKTGFGVPTEAGGCRGRTPDGGG